MKNLTKINILLLAVISGTISCASSKVTQARGFIPFQMKIALAPSGGVLADAIGIELFNKGYFVVDTNQMSNLMVRLNMTEIEFSKPQNLAILKDQGIAGVLAVKSVSGYDGKPQSATVRILSTEVSGQIIAAVSWQNGWGGQEGSILDRGKRKDISGAAKEIVDALTTVEFKYSTVTPKINVKKYTNFEFLPSKNVEVIRTKPVDRDFLEIAELSISIYKLEIEDAVNLITEKAKELGADALIIIGERSKEPVFGYPKRELFAVAIKYK